VASQSSSAAGGLKSNIQVLCNYETVTTRMKPSVIVWGLETVPDPAANGLVGKSDVEVREAIGEKFPFSGKHLYCFTAFI
jgi:hypothetical protein